MAKNIIDELNKKQKPPTKEDLTLAALDRLIKTYVEKRDAYDRAKEVASKFEKERSAAEFAVLNALKQSDKKSYTVDGIGTISRKEYLNVRVPKGDAKITFFEYLEARGKDFFYGLATVNSQTLQSWYKSELENAEAAGIFPFSIPGIEDPVATESITFRKAK